MSFTFDFLLTLAQLLGHVLPLFAGLGGIIAALSVWIGWREGWPVGDSLYFGFITALTVGYGDLRPTHGSSRLLAIIVALFGLVTAGILVAIAVEAVGMTFRAQQG